MFCLGPELLIPGIPVIQKLENDRSEFIEHFAENNHDFDVIDDRRIGSALARSRKNRERDSSRGSVALNC